MKLRPLFAIVVFTGLLWSAARAEGDFTAAMSAEEKAATGLDKLSPEELARLKAAVERYKTGEVAAVQVKAEAQANAVAKEAEQKVVAAQEKAAAAEAKVREVEAKVAGEGPEAKQKGPGWLHALITLNRVAKDAKGAEPIESRLVGEFRGWRAQQIFDLENGQRWQWVEGADYVTPPMPPPKVKIYPGVFGSFWMEFEGVRPRVRVKPLRLE